MNDGFEIVNIEQMEEYKDSEIIDLEMKQNLLNNVTSEFFNFLVFVRNYKKLNMDFCDNYKNLLKQSKLPVIIDEESKKNNISIFQFKKLITNVINKQMESTKTLIAFLDFSIENAEDLYKKRDLDGLIKNFEEKTKKFKESIDSYNNDYEKIKKYYNECEKKLTKLFCNKTNNVNEKEINEILKKPKEKEKKFKASKGIDIDLLIKEYKNEILNYSSSIQKISLNLNVELFSMLCGFFENLKEINEKTLLEINNAIKSNHFDEKNMENDFTTKFFCSAKNKRFPLKTLNPNYYKLRLMCTTQQFNANNICKDKSIKIEDFLDPVLINSLNDVDKLKILEIMGNFNLIDKSNYNLDNEKLKLHVKNLAIKFLSFFDEKSGKINEDEYKELLDYLKQKQDFRIEFLKYLNNFRIKGNYSFPPEQFKQLCDIFYLLCDYMENDKLLTEYVIILSLTFYKEEEQKKIYVSEIVNKHKIFNHDFWKNYLTTLINKNLKQLEDSFNFKDEKEITDKEKHDKIVNGIFPTILTVTKNMKEFNLDKKEIHEITDYYSNLYGLFDSQIETIKAYIEMDSA